MRYALMGALLLSVPAAADADVLKRKRASTDERAAVEERLGADASALTDADVRYFGAEPDRVRVVGAYHGGIVWVGCCSGVCALIALLLILL